MFGDVVQRPFNGYAEDWNILPSLMLGQQYKRASLRYVFKPCDLDLKEGVKRKPCRNLNNIEKNPSSLTNINSHGLLFNIDLMTDLLNTHDLFNSHTLGQISRLINIPFKESGAVIGQQLTRDYCQDGIEEIQGGRYLNNLIHNLF